MLDVRFRQDQVSKQKIHQIGLHICRVLENIRVKCDQAHTTTMLSLSTLSEAEQRQLLEKAHGGVRTFPRQYETIVAAFNRMALQLPTALAVEYASKRHSYSEVRMLAANITKQLIESLPFPQCVSNGAPDVASAQIAPQPVVIISASRSVELIAAFLAILCTGAVYVPIDVSMPADRCRIIAEDSGACCLITDQPCWQNKYAAWWADRPVVFINNNVNVNGNDKAEKHQADLEIVSSSPRKFGKAASEWMSTAASKVDVLWDAQVSKVALCRPNKLYNIIYTSGTTGKPKVCVTLKEVDFCD